MAFDKLEKSIIRERIAVHKKRPDGRGENEIRDISIEVGVTPRTHGSALFTRGQTQALSVVAMGTLKEEMRLDTLGLETKKYYWHHYNFPPFSVGEAGRMGGVKRRDVGHGALAERALAPMVPSIEERDLHLRRSLTQYFGRLEAAVATGVEEADAERLDDHGDAQFVGGEYRRLGGVE